jgi:predicted metal-binding membrane protein
VNKVIWLRAAIAVAVRGPGKGLLVATAAGWIALAWLLDGNRSTHLAHSSAQFTAMWTAMILAMAPPLLFREVGRLWRASLRRLRRLTIAWFACGYVAIWSLVGVLFAPLVGVIATGSVRIILAIALVTLWQCSPLRQRCLNACHRSPTLRAFGAGAQWDSLRFGMWTGCLCAATCGLLMLLVVLANEYHLTVMAAASIVTTIERHLPARRPRWQFPIFRRRSLDWPDLTAARRSAA